MEEETHQIVSFGGGRIGVDQGRMSTEKCRLFGFYSNSRNGCRQTREESSSDTGSTWGFALRGSSKVGAQITRALAPKTMLAEVGFGTAA